MIILQTVSFSLKACISGNAFAFHSLIDFFNQFGHGIFGHVRFCLKASHGKDFGTFLAQRVKNSISDCLELSFPRLSGEFTIIGNVTLVQTRLVNNTKWYCNFLRQVIPDKIIKWHSCSDLGHMKREEKSPSATLCGWCYWGKSSGSPERSDGLVASWLQRAQGEKTDKEREQKHFRYLICHWSNHKLAVVHKGLLINIYYEDKMYEWCNWGSL